MKTLVESLFDRDIISKNINITDIKDAELVTLNALEKSLDIKSYNASEVSYLHNDIFDRDKWFLVHLNGYSDNSAVIFLQHNKTYIANDKSSYVFTVRLSLYIGYIDDSPYVKTFDCDIYKDVDFCIGSTVYEKDIIRKTKLKDRYFKSNTNGILKYLGDLFVKFKKCISNNGFDEVFENICLSDADHYNDIRYENYAYKNLQSIFEKMLK